MKRRLPSRLARAKPALDPAVLAASLDPARVVERLAELAQIRLGASAVGVWLLERSGAALVLRGAVDLKRPDAVARLACDPAAGVGRAITVAPPPVLLPDAAAGATTEARAWLEAEEARALLAVPLPGEHGTRGLLVAFTRGRRTLPPGRLAAATALAATAGPALRNALAHAEQRGRAERAEILLAVTEALAAGISPGALEEVGGRIARALEAERCTIRLDAAGAAPAPAPPGADRLVVPVMAGTEQVGTLTVTAPGRRRWEPSAVDLAAAVARQVGLAAGIAGTREAPPHTRAEVNPPPAERVQAETLRALGELAGGAAHHLNNLLTIVVGRVQILLRTSADERVRTSLQIVERAAKDGAEVVRRLQQFARTGRLEQARLVDVNAVVGEALATLRERRDELAARDGAAIAVDARLGAVPPVAGDAEALREALVGVMINALDAVTRGGGRVTVETRADGAHVVIAVTDDGPGMPEAVRQRAHEPFFTTKGVRATGLGLSVAHGVLRRHGGEVVIASAEDRGTVVSLRLPVPAATAPAWRDDRPLRILLIDDEAEVRDAMADMLAMKGHTVLTAAGGRDGVSLLEADPGIDLVLTDLVMPDMSGWDVADAAKVRRPGVPVGVITGSGEAATALGGRRASVDVLVPKPVTVESLNDAVDRLRVR